MWTWIDCLKPVLRIRPLIPIGTITDLLLGLAAFRESPTIVIIQYFNFSSTLGFLSGFIFYFSHISFQSVVLFQARSETFIFCLTCTPRLVQVQSRNFLELHQYWNELHGNLHLAPVLHSGKRNFRKIGCISNGGMENTKAWECAYLTVSQRYNYTMHYFGDRRPPQKKMRGPRQRIGY